MAAGFRNFSSSGIECCGVMRPRCGAIFGGEAVGVRFGPVAPGGFAGLGDRGYGAVYEDDHVIFRPEVAGIDVAA
jgi:hypothetical protein